MANYELHISADGFEELERLVAEAAANLRRIGEPNGRSAATETSMEPVGEVENSGDDLGIPIDSNGKPITNLAEWTGWKVDNLWDRLGDNLKRVLHAIARLQADGADTTVPSIANAIGESSQKVRPRMSVLRRSIDVTDRYWGGPPMLTEATWTGSRVRYRFNDLVLAEILQRELPR
jgi:hypothetical protein